MKHLIIFFLILVMYSPSNADELMHIRGAFHVHSDFSSGSYSLENVVEHAKNRGIQALIFADNFLLKFEYGIYPMSNLIKKRIEYKSVMRSGTDKYLDAINWARARYPDMVIIPGVEVVPHYYWAGSLIKGDLTMLDGQKNLLVIGMENPEDYKYIPAVGNNEILASRPISPPKLIPALLFIPGLILLKVKKTRRRRLGHLIIREKKSFRKYGVLLIFLGIIGLINNYPFRQASFDQYQTALGVKPFQSVIDYANSKNGMVFWSFPEAKDFSIQRIGFFQATVKTNPYPEDLIKTFNYTGYGAIYEDTTTFSEPGKYWDLILGDYCIGAREKPTWGVGESGFHWEGQAKKSIVNIITVFLTPKKSRGSIIEAMRNGRMYAVRRDTTKGLEMDEFSIGEKGNPKKVLSGDELPVAGENPVEINVKIRYADDVNSPVVVRVIRSGEVIKTVKGETPLKLTFTDIEFNRKDRFYYRIEAKGNAPHHLLSNPIFAKVIKK